MCDFDSSLRVERASFEAILVLVLGDEQRKWNPSLKPVLV